MDQLSDMPPFAWVVFAVTLAIIFGVRHLGLLQGAKATPEISPAAAPVAAVIVDPTALNRASAALEAHTAETRKLIEVAHEGVRQIGILAVEADRIREELRIQREIEKRRPN
ncbi:hypothetical protein [Rhizobium rhizoryzae]|uniref:hypothetical protein n=1 Tax=Rhizobium rhizoryzae TaxID=451876 RepID=UPI00289CC5C2|nr:hypothetical protein [Rhizobium rhizoryzae]